MTSNNDLNKNDNSDIETIYFIISNIKMEFVILKHNKLLL